MILGTTLIGVPVHELDERTNADESPDTSKNPVPLIAITCEVPFSPLSIGITLGVNDVTETTLRTPTAKYGEKVVQRPHNWYTPPTAPLTFTLTMIELEEFHPLV